MVLKVGQSGTFSKIITEKDINTFANLTGDTNPIHMNENAALALGFRKRIVHGMFAGSLISTVLGTIFPGEGTIYLEQNLKFIRPVYLGEKVTVTVTVKEILKLEKGIYKLQTDVSNETGDTTIEGYAVIKYYSEI